MDRFEIPLDLEGVKSEQVKFTQTNEIVITVANTVEVTHCHQCGKPIFCIFLVDPFL